MNLVDNIQSNKEKVMGSIVWFLGCGATVLSFVFLFLLLEHITVRGVGGLDYQFLTSMPSRKPEEAGVWVAVIGTLYMMGLTILFAVPVGIFTAIYLEEFAGRSRINHLIRLNIANLAGVPSIVYGMLGLAFFVRALELGSSILAGALTMGLLILPMIIIASSEALKAVSQGLRQASFGVGGTRVQTVFGHVLPQALPGIMTGIILALSRAVGETAPVLMVGAVVSIYYAPESLLDNFTTISLQIYSWTKSPNDGLRDLAGSAIIVLLILTLGLNALAIFLRSRFAGKRT